MSGVHLHDLRHTGNQLSGEAGASLRELMERMGHDSTSAALIYLHSSAQRQRATADQTGQNATAALGRKRGQSGTNALCPPARGLAHCNWNEGPGTETHFEMIIPATAPMAQIAFPVESLASVPDE